jgi:hypothetical protein
MADSINEMIQDAIGMSSDVEKHEAIKNGFMTRALIMATMPHSRVEGHIFSRSNGNYKLHMHCAEAGDLPYGTRPRLVMAYICSEVVKKKTREVWLGENCSEFMRDLGLPISGGKRGSVPSLKDQLRRLFGATISFEYKTEEIIPETGATKYKKFNLQIQLISKTAEFWEKPPNSPIKDWRTEITLSEGFYSELMCSCVPIDLHAIHELKESSLAIDIYLWITWRVFNLKEPLKITWQSLMAQFGSDYKFLANFKVKFIEQLKKVLKIYPVKISSLDAGILLFPNETHVPRI